jgi:hypothetical protein
MRTQNRLLTALGAAFLSLLLVVPALADRDEERTITVKTDEGESFVCRIGDDDSIRMIDGDTGETVFEFDMAALEATLEDTFAELEEALEDFELDIHFDGDDNFVRWAADDDEVVVDLDAILDGVSDAVAALGDIEFVDAHHRFRAAEGMEELEEELEALREEMRELKKELREQRREMRR